MPRTKCNACGTDIYIAPHHVDAGAEVYCSDECAALPPKPKLWDLWYYHPNGGWSLSQGGYKRLSTAFNAAEDIIGAGMVGQFGIAIMPEGMKPQPENRT